MSGNLNGMPPRPRIMRIVPAAFTLVLLASCGTGTDAGAFGAALLVGDWQLTSGSLDGAGIPLVDGQRITLNLTESEFGGIAACNSYGGTHTVSGAELLLGAIAVTEMACAPLVMESEATYLAALSRVISYNPTEDRLRLAGDGVALDYVRLEPVPTAMLVDTVWELDTLIEADVSSSVRGEPATLELRNDGTLVGGTGCRALTGRWIESGDIIRLVEFAADGDCPADLQDQDAHVATVLGDGFTVEIEGSRLTVTAPGRIGLSYRAR